MLYIVRIHFKKGELPKVEAIIWFLTLIILGIIVSFKSSADFIRGFFKVDRLTDIIVIVSLMFVGVVMIENRIQINKLRGKLERIVRDRAMDQK
jgi:hypothetical protein